MVENQGKPKEEAGAEDNATETATDKEAEPATVKHNLGQKPKHIISNGVKYTTLPTDTRVGPLEYVKLRIETSIETLHKTPAVTSYMDMVRTLKEASARRDFTINKIGDVTETAKIEVVVHEPIANPKPINALIVEIDKGEVVSAQEVNVIPWEDLRKREDLIIYSSERIKDDNESVANTEAFIKHIEKEYGRNNEKQYVTQLLNNTEPTLEVLEVYGKVYLPTDFPVWTKVAEVKIEVTEEDREPVQANIFTKVA